MATVDERGPGGESARERAVREHASLLQDAAHLSIVGAVLLTGFALVKSYAVGHFSLTTGAALLTTAPLTVLLGSLMSYAYWILPLAALALLYGAVRARRRIGAWTWEGAALLGLAALSALLSPVRSLLTCGLAFLVFLLVARGPRAAAEATGADAPDHRSRWRSRWASLTSSPLFRTPVFFVVAVLWVVLGSLTRPWTPVELVAFQEGAEQRLVVGNVLSADGEWTTVMRAGDRGLNRIRSEDVVSRRLCHLVGAQAAGQAPLLWELQDRPYRSPNRSCRKLADQQSDVQVTAGSFPG
ncbi:hypothetical protein [Geodermatophilus sp. CPCC 205761]|uniref:hypothetical protein n=1 Tax=Geodermatophilus sp. CPCC 205761 TaxID=2936597 RepID=UPI003EE8F344